MSKTTFPGIDELRAWWLANHNLPEVVQALRTRDELIAAGKVDDLKLAYAEQIGAEIDEALDNEFHLAIMWAIAKAYEAARATVHEELLSMTSLHDLVAEIDAPKK